MFPTFISILDIQSWWEVPSIAHFCSLFRTAFNLLDFDIEDLEEALLTDGTEETSWLQELIVRLLSGCLPNNEISTFNYQMFLRRLFRQKCQEHDQYNPFNTDIDFQLLPLRTKVDILHALCDFRLDADDVLEQLKNLEAESLRVEPLGYDSNDSAYWYFYGTRLYREDFKTKNNKKKSVWQVICFTEDDWFQLNKKFKKSTAKCERQLYRTLSENFLPELPRLFREKERLARKRLLENQPRRTSRRLKEKEEELVETTTTHDSGKVESESGSEKSERRYEMAGTKARQKKSKSRQRKLSDSSTNSKDKASKKKKNEEVSKSSSTSAATTTVGRQTNNSLAAATGQIVIQPVANTHKKKLKTSQVFRQTDEDLITGMHKILDYVKNHEDAWPFADPVDEEYAPNYYSVIRKPMDLQRMEERLDAGYYKSFSKFRDDFQLIVDNCRLYNGAENEYTEMVDNLSKVFETATSKFLDQISSSDDEIAVEFNEQEAKENKKLKPSKRKPTLAAKTNKREHSLSEESDKRSLSYDEDDSKKKQKKKKVVNKKKEKSPVRSRSTSRNSFFRSYSSSPPPSSVPSSPDNRFDFFRKQKSPNKDQPDDSTVCDKPIQPVKDKHNKLRETIEKLKAKSEITNRLDDFDMDVAKENKNKKEKNKKIKKKDVDEDSNSTMESLGDKKKKKTVKNAAIEALTIATEQTLKDINKWLDDTPKFSEFSSASNSPSYPPLEDFDLNNDRKKLDKVNVKKDCKDLKRRTFIRDPAKFLKRREIQRTIDRLQPGKSKGNLISSVQNTKTDELFPSLGPLSKKPDSKNSLIVKTDENAPKLSLGSVLDSFGRHKFVDDAKNQEEVEEAKEEPKEKVEEKLQVPVTEESMMSSATPNLSAWFKAFGAPKVPQKKETKDAAVEEKKEETKLPEASPTTETSQPIARQRKISTGSSVSERSSFSQDMDSPRVGIDERLGAYPAPYPSPLHRSPSVGGASPRPELSPKAPYPPFNGQIKVGFYQDTVSNKSSPDKSCSPRDNPQSPYMQPSEHVYTPNTTTTQNIAYSYPNSPYYTHTANYTENYYEEEKDKTQFPVKKRQYNEETTAPPFENEIQEPVKNSPVINYSTPSYNDNYLNIPTRDRKFMTYNNPMPQYNRTDLTTYTRAPPSSEQTLNHQQEISLHYQNYKTMETQQPAQVNYTNSDVSIPRPTYDMELRGNIANLTHIVDRYNNEDRMLMQSGGHHQYYDKHMFNKPISTSASSLPIFQQNMAQSYVQNMQTVEKKTKKRKTPKNAPEAPPSSSPNQGFQSYAGLKNPPMEPSAISLKTASVVPGSAFNFGPAPPSFGSALYDKDVAYSNFLEDFRATPNYYDKQRQVSGTRQPAPPPAYPFMGARQATPPSYPPLAGHFAQAPLMDAAASPLYQHYLPGVLNQGLLGPPGAYPPGYHLSMRQQYESMTRPPWL